MTHEGYWYELWWELQYLKGTRSLKLCINMNSLMELEWHIDASHNVHWDCKGQSGAVMILGKGIVISALNKTNTNTKSPCKSELMWEWMITSRQSSEACLLFKCKVLTFQMSDGYKTTKVLHSLKIMGRYPAACGENTWKRSIFITDKITQGDIILEYLRWSKYVFTWIPNQDKAYHFKGTMSWFWIAPFTSPMTHCLMSKLNSLTMDLKSVMSTVDPKSQVAQLWCKPQNCRTVLVIHLLEGGGFQLEHMDGRLLILLRVSFHPRQRYPCNPEHLGLP